MSRKISDIILIGPISTGKSTLGRLLAQKLGIPQCSMDDVRLDYYKEINYDEQLAKQIREKKDFKVFIVIGNPLKPTRLKEYFRNIAVVLLILVQAILFMKMTYFSNGCNKF